jgi:hypothetical protein
MNIVLMLREYMNGGVLMLREYMNGDVFLVPSTLPYTILPLRKLKE